MRSFERALSCLIGLLPREQELQDIVRHSLCD